MNGPNGWNYRFRHHTCFVDCHTKSGSLLGLVSRSSVLFIHTIQAYLLLLQTWWTIHEWILRSTFRIIYHCFCRSHLSYASAWPHSVTCSLLVLTTYALSRQLECICFVGYIVMLHATPWKYHLSMDDGLPHALDLPHVLWNIRGKSSIVVIVGPNDPTNEQVGVLLPYWAQETGGFWWLAWVILYPWTLHATPFFLGRILDWARQSVYDFIIIYSIHYV